MIVGIGCDIIDSQSVTKLGWDKDQNLRERIFSKKELMEYSNSGDNLTYLMGRFAVKEATTKCLGLGLIDGISLLDIEVLRSEDGQPCLSFHGAIKEVIKNQQISNWNCSISHTDNYTIAFVVAESF